MPIIIVHGTALVAISQKISALKKGFNPLSVIEFNEKELKWENLAAEIATPQLFSPQRLVIVEDADEKVSLEAITEDPNLTVVLKFTKLLAVNSPLLKLALAKKMQILELSEKEEKSIFPFLDLLAEKNPQALAKLDGLLEQFGGQYLLTMIFYMLRRMVQNPQKLPAFVAKKMENQRKNFPIKLVTDLYQEALETDFKIKTGQTEERMGLTLLVNRILTR